MGYSAKNIWGGIPPAICVRGLMGTAENMLISERLTVLFLSLFAAERPWAGEHVLSERHALVVVAWVGRPPSTARRAMWPRLRAMLSCASGRPTAPLALASARLR